MNSEIKTNLMITRKYLNKLYDLTSKQFDIDVRDYNLVTQPGSIRVDALGRMSLYIRDIETTLKEFEDCISLAEDMEQGLNK